MKVEKAQEKSSQTVPERSSTMMDLAQKNFKVASKNMFKNQKNYTLKIKGKYDDNN